MRLKDRRVALIVTGGIAAFKSASLASMLVKMGAEVRVCMTANACKFISPLTFETLTKNRVVTDTFSREMPYEVEHISMAKWAELIVVAPATANIIAKAACGIGDDYASTLLLAATSPVLFVPAMNTQMLHHPSVQTNIATLKMHGKVVMDSGVGLLACGDVGQGRMPEPEEISECVCEWFNNRKLDMQSLKVLVTAGPTCERIDDVRYITNRSSGKMGYAVAEVAANRKASVTLISGKVNIAPPEGVELVRIESAAEMFDEVSKRFDACDILIMAAAVADYTPSHKIDGKLKKGEDFALELVRTKDILQEMGARKKKQILVGFAAEAANLEQNAKDKLVRKNLDMIAANDISRADIGFGAEENAMTFYFSDGATEKIDKMPKHDVAGRLLDAAIKLMI